MVPNRHRSRRIVVAAVLAALPAAGAACSADAGDGAAPPTPVVGAAGAVESTPTAPAASGSVGGPAGGGGDGATVVTAGPIVDGPAGPATGVDVIPADLDVQQQVEASGAVVVTVRGTAHAGSQLYGLEARLCESGASVRYDADLHPTQTGNCVVEPVAAGTDARVVVAATAPYQSAELTFRAGAGTSAYQTQDGRSVEITCTPADPCDLVVKVQIPGGFGFRSYPIAFA